MSKEEAIKACERIMKHTPGPWTYLDGKRSLLHIETAHDSQVAGVPICSVNIKHEANAKLIAAAPEMLDLLIKIADNPNLDWSGEAADLVVKATT